jgi:hypothetical protein
MLDRVIGYIERNQNVLFRRDPEDDQSQTCWEVARIRLAIFLASSAESVGAFWLGEIAEVV